MVSIGLTIFEKFFKFKSLMNSKVYDMVGTLGSMSIIMINGIHGKQNWTMIIARSKDVR